MKYILCISLLLVNKRAICQSSESNAARNVVKTSVPHIYQKNAFESFDRNSWRLPAEDGFDWVRSVQRIIDLSNESNKPLSYIDSNKTITSLLIDLLNTGKAVAYSDTVDSAIMTSNNAITSISKENSAIKSYMLLESWKFNRSNGKMIVRIIGIAPCIEKDTSFHPTAWFKYYPLRAGFKTHNVSIVRKEKRKHSKQDKFDVISLEDYFEHRLFSGEIIKVTPYDSSDKRF